MTALREQRATSTVTPSAPPPEEIAGAAEMTRPRVTGQERPAEATRPGVKSQEQGQERVTVRQEDGEEMETEETSTSSKISKGIMIGM